MILNDGVVSTRQNLAKSSTSRTPITSVWLTMHPTYSTQQQLACEGGVGTATLVFAVCIAFEGIPLPNPGREARISQSAQLGVHAVP